MKGWLLWFWRLTDPRPRIDPVIGRRIKETKAGLLIAEDLQHNSRAGNLQALQHAAYLLDLPPYSVTAGLDAYLREPTSTEAAHAIA